MKLFKVIPKPRHGGGFINPEYIMSIRPGDEWGCDITVQDGMARTFYDSRTPDEIAEILDPTKKSQIKFPNGFTSWMETHHEVVTFIAEQRVKVSVSDNEINETADMHGTTGLYRLAEEWTDEFEDKFNDHDWSEGENFFDEIETFLNNKLK